VASSEKLGSYLARRKFIARLGGWAVVVAIMGVFFRLQRIGYIAPYYLDRAALVVIAIALIFAIDAALTRCPKCGALLALRAPSSFSKSYTGACPQCGASFDEPWHKSSEP
jgi:predicted RNA-binding Zn-ribbon protein involved in translation (DUF1610 family)